VRKALWVNVPVAIFFLMVDWLSTALLFYNLFCFIYVSVLLLSLQLTLKLIIIKVLTENGIYFTKINDFM